MTKVFKRGICYWIEYPGPDRRRRREAVSSVLGIPPTAVTPELAAEALEQRIRGVHTGRHVEARHRTLTLGDCLSALKDNLALRGKTVPGKIDGLVKELGSVRAQDVTGRTLEAWASDWLSSTPNALAPATVVARLGYVTQALKLAVAHQRLAQAPTAPRITVDNARQGFVDRPAFEAILTELERHQDPVYAHAAAWAYETAWRREEIVGLRWPEVDRPAGQVRLEQTKNGDKRVLPLVGPLKALIETRWAARAIGVPFVFHRAGHPLRGKRLLIHFQTAAREVGYPDLLFHDLRRSAVRNMELAGVPRAVAMKISGHRRESIYTRYAITTTEDVAAALERVARKGGA